MDLSNLKNSLQKLSVFKNKSLLIPVIIVLVSILLFIPTLLISGELKKKIQTDSIDKALNQIKRLQQKGVSEGLLEEKTKQLQARSNDANQIKALAVETTQRQMLLPDIFDVNDPNKLSPVIFQQFGQKYQTQIEQLIANASIAGAKRAGDCPSQTELNRAIEQAGATRSRRGMGMDLYDMGGRGAMPGTLRRPSAGRGGPIGGLRMMSEVERLVVDQVCKKRAEEISFYVTPSELSGYTFWEKYDLNTKKTEAVEDCWYYQLGYWVIEDIFDTITTMNADYDNVLDAPVKRLMRVNFTMDTNRGGMGFARVNRGRLRATTGDNKDRPRYVISTDKKTWLTEPCTGRYSGDEIDVIHFDVVCVVSTKDFMPFIQKLCSAKEHKYIDQSGQEHTYKHNQITILETNFTSVDKEDITQHNNYCYGDGGVIELDLICEYVFNKEAYENVKPESVKKTLLGEESS
jgi:hypothetical protein